MFPFLIKTLTLDQGFKKKTKQTTKKKKQLGSSNYIQIGPDLDQAGERQALDR